MKSNIANTVTQPLSISPQEPVSLSVLPGQKAFLELPDDCVRTFIQQEKPTLTGIFSSDGNRRMVMAFTGLTPKNDAFYEEYVRIGTLYFMNALEVFFSHGVCNLFFPLFGASLLHRDDKYKEKAMKGLLFALFREQKWLEFYNRYGIRVKAYGKPSILDKEFPLDQPYKDILNTIELTKFNTAHTLYYGFFSHPWPFVEILRKRETSQALLKEDPDLDELIELYYGEKIPIADFFINSMHSGGFGVVPPFMAGKDTRMYTSPVPGVYAIDKNMFRKILYDLIIRVPEYQSPDFQYSESPDLLRDYFESNRNMISGCRKKVGDFWVLDFE